MRLLFRRRTRYLDVAGPLCEAWEADGVGEYWPDCYHGSCWAIIYGERSRV